MGRSVTLGGDRLGSGNKMKVGLHGFERSTHDLGYLWRSTMASGTLVPFMNIVGLPGDTFDINLGCDVKTLPTVGPLFGSFKVQLDVFACPIRLYQGQLHNNKLGIGLEMSKVKLPQMILQSKNPFYEGWKNKIESYENWQINQSSLLAYLGIRGIGYCKDDGEQDVSREFNALPLISYFDIYKNYYANKSEEIGYFLHSEANALADWSTAELWHKGIKTDEWEKGNAMDVSVVAGDVIIINGVNLESGNTYFSVNSGTPTLAQAHGSIVINHERTRATFECGLATFTLNDITVWSGTSQETIELKMFELSNIDDMREKILTDTWKGTPFYVSGLEIEPYKSLTGRSIDGHLWARRIQEGLAIKTYQSDIFNNWVSTDWIDGANGISKVTAIDTTDGSFTIDTLNIAKKVYDMLNRIAVSGGSYDDWLEAVYDHDIYGKPETPVYYGGLSKEVVFQEVIAMAESGDKPQGNLSGRGTMTGKHKGGHVTIKCSEPCVILGIVSLTPRIDYSQGNDFTVNLKTMDDFHKPNLDEIGFQELITEQMHFMDVEYDNINDKWITKSAGKQPAWLNYMTAYNKVFGEFANPESMGYMILNRNYEIDKVNGGIKDLTTYIDPMKFNQIFAESDRYAQNFWTQISCDITARRKMSAKLMPNL